MFSIKALRNITVKSLTFFSSTADTAPVQVYVRSGPYRDHVSSADGWTLVYNSSVVQLGRENATSLGGFEQEVVISTNEVKSFFIFSPKKVMYKAGNNDTSEGALFASDDAVEFYEGIGLDGPIFNSTVYSPRVFRGSIIYDVIAASSPNTCGNSICEVYESAATCPADCRDLSLVTTDVAAKGAEGAMFVIKALRDVNITSLDFFGASVNTNLVQVWTRSGPYVGHVGSRASWEKVFDNSSVQIKGRVEPTPLGGFTSEVHVSANEYQSFYVYSPSKVLYRAGTSEGAPFASNDAIEFYEGIGTCQRHMQLLWDIVDNDWLTHIALFVYRCGRILSNGDEQNLLTQGLERDHQVRKTELKLKSHKSILCSALSLNLQVQRCITPNEIA